MGSTGHLDVEHLLRLQRTAGNSAVVNLLKGEETNAPPLQERVPSEKKAIRHASEPLALSPRAFSVQRYDRNFKLPVQGYFWGVWAGSTKAKIRSALKEVITANWFIEAFVEHGPVVKEVLGDTKQSRGFKLGWVVDQAFELWTFIRSPSAGVDKENVRAHAPFFLAHVLPPLKGHSWLKELLQTHWFVLTLAKEAPNAYRQFAQNVPQLRLVHTAMAAVKDRRQEDADRPPQLDDVVEEVFEAFIRNPDFVGYAATRAADSLHILHGEKPEQKAGRLKRIRPLGLSDVPSTDCHSLLYIFQDLLLTYPGIDLTDRIRPEHLDRVVLTQPLNRMPGGLVSNFGGNVFDDDGKLTDQIAFTGDEGARSHSWLVVNNRAYDPLFGTKGDQVRKAVAAEFKKLGESYKQIGGEYFLLPRGGYRPPTFTDSFNLIAPSNTHGFFTATFRLTTDPLRWGVDPSSGTKRA